MIARLLFFSAALVALGYVPCANAHEARLAYLEINETASNRYDVLWRTPLLSGMRLPVALRFAEGTRNVVKPHVKELTDSLVWRRVIEVARELAGKRLESVVPRCRARLAAVRGQQSRRVAICSWGAGLFCAGSAQYYPALMRANGDFAGGVRLARWSRRMATPHRQDGASRLRCRKTPRAI